MRRQYVPRTVYRKDLSGIQDFALPTRSTVHRA